MIRIGVDIDNVVSDSYPAYLLRFNTRFKTEIRLEEIRDFYFLNKYVHDSRINNGREMVNFIDEMVIDEEFQMAIPPMVNAREVISGWIKKGYQIHYITLRPISVEKPTRRWLENFGFWIKGVKLDLYDENRGHESDILYKKEMADSYGLDLFIEDSIEIANVMTIPVLLLDRPWNRGKLKKNVTRVTSWKEIAEKAATILKKP